MVFVIAWREVNTWVASQFPTRESFGIAAIAVAVVAAISVYVWSLLRKDGALAEETVTQIGWLAAGLSVLAIGLVFSAYPTLLDECADLTGGRYQNCRDIQRSR